MSAIFISYRRSDSEGEAGRLADDLSRRFGESAVFMDVDTIQPGRDFRKAIDESIRSCDLLLAIIGPEWFGAADAAGHQRLTEDNDYVRLEIASALKRDIAVIPVMVRGARMPLADALPKDLEDLAYRNAVELTHARWRSDVQFLVDALKPMLEARMGEAACADDGVAAAAKEPRREAVRGPAQEAGLPGQAKAGMAKSEAGTARSAAGADGGSERVAEGTPDRMILDAASLQWVSHELARYIGPIAPVLVKRAARTCGSLEALLEQTAKEIESPRDRAAYLVLRTEHARGR